MQLMIQPSSMKPIYEQIHDQICSQIQSGTLKSNDLLPSVRVCAREYKISALTVKKAYDQLEKEGFVKTVQGKGTYVAEISLNLVREEAQRKMEAALEKVLDQARSLNMSREEIHELVDLLLEENHD